jgi:hypothetical protein
MDQVAVVRLAEEMLEEVQREARFTSTHGDALLLLAKRDGLSELLRRARGHAPDTSWSRTIPGTPITI